MQTGLRVPDIAQCLHLFFLRAMQMGLIMPDGGQYFRFPIISPSYQALLWTVFCCVNKYGSYLHCRYCSLQPNIIYSFLCPTKHYLLSSIALARACHPLQRKALIYARRQAWQSTQPPASKHIDLNFKFLISSPGFNRLDYRQGRRHEFEGGWGGVNALEGGG